MSGRQRALSAVGRLRPPAVRQRSASFSRAPARFRRSPRPAPPRKTAIFFVPCHPRPFMFSIIGRAEIGRRSSTAQSGNGNGFGNAFGNRKSVPNQTLAPAFPAFPAFARPCNIHARAHMCVSFLFLGTWEQGRIIYEGQWVRCSHWRSQRSFPPVGWEQARADGDVVQAGFGAGNKIEAEYGVQRPLDGDAREKFRASIAAAGAFDLVAGVLEQLGAAAATWSTRNGGFLPFLAAADRHVGRAMLDGSAERAGNAALSDHGQKLRQLQAFVDQAPGAFALAPIGRPTPGTPNATRAVPSMLPLHALGIGFAIATGPMTGDLNDRQSQSMSEGPQGLVSGRGPGGLRLANRPSRGAVRTRQCEGGKRAGVDALPPSRRPHEAGEFATLRRIDGAVNWQNWGRA